MKPRLILAAISTLLFLDKIRASKHQLHPRIDEDCDCGISGELLDGFIGGVVLAPHVFPWIVAIFNKGTFHCGGTLINDRFVLTAGHCVKWTNHADLTIGLGMHDIEKLNEGYMMQIDKVILHENFQSNYLRDVNDIALIQLKHPVKFNKNVKPACLPYKGFDYTDENVKIIGWGRVVITGKYRPSRFLHQAILKVISWAACKNSSLGYYITESMMCAYNDDTDACQGDSGGPLLYKRMNGKYEVIGIISWGVGCANRGMPGVYVKNTDYLDWIKYHSREAIYCMNE